MTQYYKSPEQIMLIHPMDRVIAKLFGKESMIYRCKECKKIPTEMYGQHCFKHRKL